ncbi:MAG: four helix bundle protein [Ignavibacteria bacterium]|nr:four helix bundle protein [Ignavibacteria bacterium]
MKENNVVKEKSYNFVLRIIKFYKYLNEHKKENVISKQILRCGTSIGANIEEALGAQSEKDYFAKICISYKECREAHYWIRLLTDSGYIKKEQSSSLLDDCEELLKIISSIQKSIKAKFDKNRN